MKLIEPLKYSSYVPYYSNQTTRIFNEEVEIIIIVHIKKK